MIVIPAWLLWGALVLGVLSVAVNLIVLCRWLSRRAMLRRQFVECAVGAKYAALARDLAIQGFQPVRHPSSATVKPPPRQP